MKYFYCDSCFLITSYKDGNLEVLSQYKDLFFISNTQIEGELIYPKDLADKVRQSVTVIDKDREEIVLKTSELFSSFVGLSRFDCLCMAYALIDGYCLITDDKVLIKKCISNNINIKSTEQIIKEFKNGGAWINI